MPAPTDIATLSTSAIEAWLTAHRAAIAAGVNIGEIDRCKAHKFEVELIRRLPAQND